MGLKPTFQGRLIAIGGKEDKADDLVVLKRVVQEVGTTNYKVGVITTASENPKQRGEDYSNVFTSLGASSVEIFNIGSRAQANDKILAKTLEGVDLVFITGGDQLRLTTILGGSLILQAIAVRLGDIAQ
ncbi:MAG: Type 1 glutamine amidotransferase-like domain-containing protein [Pseudodesulfovibrio sp.]|nr:Type 1 glutamine amidotransferase-like domain-containing protein [Pseudodesulfovibrio sp.]